MDTLTCDLSHNACDIPTPAHISPTPSGGTNLNYGFAFLVVNFWTEITEIIHGLFGNMTAHEFWKSRKFKDFFEKFGVHSSCDI